MQIVAKDFHQIRVLAQIGDFVPEIYAQIEQNLKRISKRVTVNKESTTTPLAVVCYGPSLKGCIDELRFYVDQNLMTCSGAHDFLINRGIIPAYHAECDWREHKLAFIQNPRKEVKYLISSAVNSKMLDKLNNVDVVLWNSDMRPFYKYPVNEVVFKSLGSVGLQCLLLGHALGFREFHVYGMDCSFETDGTRHAGVHNGSKDDSHFWVKTNSGKFFLTSMPFVFYAKMFVEVAYQLQQQEGATIKVAGNGLLQEYLKEVT